MTGKLKGWHAFPLLWGILVVFLVYRDIKERASPPSNIVVDSGSQPTSKIQISPPVAPSPSRRSSPAVGTSRPEPGLPITGADAPATISDAPAEQDPNEAEAPSEPETADRNEDDQAQTLAILHESLRQDPDNVDAKFKIAEILTHEKWDANEAEKAEAEKFYTDLLKLYPDHSDLRNGLATLYVQTGRVEEAVELWSGTSQEFPSPP